MVKLTTIRDSNERFANEHHERGLVCVFAGATSGIGASTLERICTMLHAPTFYVIGRSATRFAAQNTKIQNLNPSCKIIFLEAEISLLDEVDRVCKQILHAEGKLDFLYMSPGLMPLNGPQYTEEGLDACFTTSYYSRIRLTTALLPLLRKAKRPVVLSVLNAGQEKALLETDLGLDMNWSFTGVINHTVTMTSLTFDYLSKNSSNKNITFLHAAPGLVRTNIFAKLTAPEQSGFMWKIALPVIKSLAGFMYWMVGISVEESGDRQAFHLTSDSFRPGAWRIDPDSEIIPANSTGVVEGYVERGWGGKVWEHTAAVFDKISTSK